MGSGGRDTTLRRRLLLAAGTLVAVAGAVTVLALAGAFSSEDGDGDERAPSAPSPEPPPGDRAGREPGGEPASRRTTLRIGGRPTSVAASGGALWIADSFAPRGTVLESERAGAEPTTLDLGGAASDVAADGESAFFALPEEGVVERRERADPGAAETVRLRAFRPSSRRVRERRGRSPTARWSGSTPARPR